MCCEGTPLSARIADRMSSEPISPELVLVDAALGARARAALPERARSHVPPPTAAGAPLPSTPQHDRRYPVWARVTGALWLLVIGILVGGAAIPHAQDRPRVVPRDDDAVVTVCKPAKRNPATPPRSFGPQP